jgi:hypothetical protein
MYVQQATAFFRTAKRITQVKENRHMTGTNFNKSLLLLALVMCVEASIKYITNPTSNLTTPLTK